MAVPALANLLIDANNTGVGRNFIDARIQPNQIGC
jgi:hypothetical protein